MKIVFMIILYAHDIKLIKYKIGILFVARII